MKVIDLLNKIANNEKVPREIKYDNYIWLLREEFNDYFNEESYLFITGFDDFENARDFLNDEIEIIEEKPKKIEKLEYKYINSYGNVSQHRKSEEPIIDKINELQEAVNYLLEKESDK